MALEGKIADIRISVLIPVYNVERYLKECMESVLQQTKQVYEIILVDDGSTDMSGVICDEYSQRYPFIKTFHKENQGQLSARRFGISKASGNWYVFLDSDDTLKKNAIEVLSARITEDSPDRIIYGLDRVQNGRIMREFNPEIEKDKLVTDKSELYELVFTHSALNSLCRKAVKAELLSRDYSQYYHISLAEDLLQSIEIYEKGNRFLFLTTSLYNYRYNDSSITNTVKIQNYKVDFTVREMVLSFLQKENVFSDKQWNTYNDYSVKVFLEQVKTILTFNAPRNEIKKLLDKVRESEYFKRYISLADSTNLTKMEKAMLFCLKRHDYTLMIGMNKLYIVKKRFQ